MKVSASRQVSDFTILYPYYCTESFVSLAFCIVSLFTRNTRDVNERFARKKCSASRVPHDWLARVKKIVYIPNLFMLLTTPYFLNWVGPSSTPFLG